KFGHVASGVGRRNRDTLDLGFVQRCRQPMPIRFRSAMSRGLPALAVAACVAVVASFSLFRADAAEIIHTEPSTFSPIVVYEESGERCIAFGSLRAVGRQTCIDLQAPDEMVFGYTRMMMSALFIKPDPQRVLIVGLG